MDHSTRIEYDAKAGLGDLARKHTGHGERLEAMHCGREADREALHSDFVKVADFRSQVNLLREKLDEEDRALA